MAVAEPATRRIGASRPGVPTVIGWTMATEKELLEKILRELENISFLLGDLNHIRNGEYDPPRGADSGRATPVEGGPEMTSRDW